MSWLACEEEEDVGGARGHVEDTREGLWPQWTATVATSSSREGMGRELEEGEGHGKEWGK